MSAAPAIQPLPEGRPLQDRDVAVLGAGLAGISAALDCAAMGARVTLLERRRRLGGLTWSFDHNGIVMDNGQHVFLACCEAYLDFLDRVGAAGYIHGPEPLDVAVIAPGEKPGGTPVSGRLRRGDLPAPLHLAGSLLGYPHISIQERLALGRALLPLARMDVEDPRHDRITFGEWLAGHGQTERSVAAVWDLITVATVNLPAASASLAVAAMVFQTGLLRRRDGADIGWAAVPLGRLHGEFGAAALKRAGVKILSGVRVGKVRPAGSRVGWEVLTEGGSIHADQVIVALPHAEAAAVVPPDAAPSQARWAELGTSGIANVHLVYDRKVTSEPLFSGHRSPVQWVFDRSDSSGLAAEHPDRQYLAVSLSAADDDLLGRRPEALVAETKDALTRLLPATATARLVDAVVTKEHRATFRATPGSAALRPPATTGLPGLALAGAWTATGWPATMEGAVRSGRSSALALAGALPNVSEPAAYGRIPQEVP